MQGADVDEPAAGDDFFYGEAEDEGGFQAAMEFDGQAGEQVSLSRVRVAVELSDRRDVQARSRFVKV